MLFGSKYVYTREGSDEEVVVRDDDEAVLSASDDESDDGEVSQQDEDNNTEIILIKCCSLIRGKLTALYKQLLTKTTLAYISTNRTLNIVVYLY